MNDGLAQITAHAVMVASGLEGALTTHGGWSDFYTLIGATAGTLIGLIFVVVSLGADHAKAGDEHRTRIGVTPTLIHFAALLVALLPCSRRYQILRAPLRSGHWLRRVGLSG